MFLLISPKLASVDTPNLGAIAVLTPLFINQSFAEHLWNQIARFDRLGVLAIELKGHNG
jgi:hypothetical protein